MNSKGTLYIVATPIGNLQDITLRALEVLRTVQTIVCEDTRVTSVLLNKFDIKKPLIPLNEFNEEQVVFGILKQLETHDVALVSDAGTPLISDPGYRLVSTARKRGIRVIPVPGPSAVIAALCASGLPTDKFVFLGFLPKTEGKITKSLLQVKDFEGTVVLYESPYRLVKTIRAIKNSFGDIEVTLGREMTKVHEEIFSGKASGLLELYAKKQPKGEFVVLFSTKSG